MLTNVGFGMNRPRLSSWETLGQSLQRPEPTSSPEMGHPYLAWEVTRPLAVQ